MIKKISIFLFFLITGSTLKSSAQGRYLDIVKVSDNNVAKVINRKAIEIMGKKAGERITAVKKTFLG